MTIGNALEPDINTIEFVSGEWGILTIANTGRTQLGQLTGAVNLKSLKAPKVDVVGNISLDGAIDYVQLGNIFGASVSFDATDRSIMRTDTISQSDINIRGSLRTLWADGLEGGHFQSDGIKRVILNGNLTGNLTVTQGNLAVSYTHLTLPTNREV